MIEETVTLSNIFLQVKDGNTMTRAINQIYYEIFVDSNYLSIYSRINIVRFLS